MITSNAKCLVKRYLKHLSKLSAAEASCMASTAATCADSLYFRSSCDRNMPQSIPSGIKF
jgi:hypothetical protein